jgi:hypothetical protein
LSVFLSIFFLLENIRTHLFVAQHVLGYYFSEDNDGMEIERGSFIFIVSIYMYYANMCVVLFAHIWHTFFSRKNLIICVMQNRQSTMYTYYKEFGAKYIYLYRKSWNRNPLWGLIRPKKLKMGVNSIFVKQSFSKK